MTANIWITPKSWKREVDLIYMHAMWKIWNGPTLFKNVTSSLSGYFMCNPLQLPQSCFYFLGGKAASLEGGGIEEAAVQSSSISTTTVIIICIATIPVNLLIGAAVAYIYYRYCNVHYNILIKHPKKQMFLLVTKIKNVIFQPNIRTSHPMSRSYRSSSKFRQVTWIKVKGDR